MKDYIEIRWSTEDVKQVIQGFLTDSQAMEILKLVERQHDANEGVTWDTLRYTGESLGYESKGDYDE